MTRKEMLEELSKHCKTRNCSECMLNNDCVRADDSDEEIKRKYNLAILNVIEVPQIKDSGARTVFETGAVRDIQEDKGRVDLTPLDVVANLCAHMKSEHFRVLKNIACFMKTGAEADLYNAVIDFCDEKGWSFSDCILEVSMHYKQGAEKYGERNWEKGIKLHSYIDSGVRHFLKYIDGQQDERHDRAFVWNMLGAIWTMNHRPKMIDIPFELLGSQEGEE